jgi:hypothetical protein
MFNPLRRTFSKDNKEGGKKEYNKEDQLAERNVKKDMEGIK